MPVDLELVPKQKRPAGEPCCDPLVYPDTEGPEAERVAATAKAPKHCGEEMEPSLA